MMAGESSPQEYHRLCDAVVIPSPKRRKMGGGGIITITDPNEERSKAEMVLESYNEAHSKRFKLKKMCKVNRGQGGNRYMTFSAQEDGKKEITLFRGAVRFEEVLFCEVKSVYYSYNDSEDEEPNSEGKEKPSKIPKKSDSDVASATPGTLKSQSDGSKILFQSVFVRGFNKNAGEDQIRSSLEQFFESCGHITSVSVPTHQDGSVKGIAFVHFSDSNAVNQAVLLNGAEFEGSYLTVDHVRPRACGRSWRRDPLQQTKHHSIATGKKTTFPDD